MDKSGARSLALIKYTHLGSCALECLKGT